MTNETIYHISQRGIVKQLMIDNGDGTHSMAVISNETPATYLGSACSNGTGGDVTIPLPAGTRAVIISAETKPVYYEINTAASADAGGYIPTDQEKVIPLLSNLSSLHVFIAATGKAHIQFFK